MRGFLLKKIKSPGRKRILTQYQIKWLTNLEKLESMSDLSLRKRCRVVMDHIGLERMDSLTLWRYYLRYGIKFKRSDKRFWKSMAENKQIKKNQLQFVQNVGTIINERAYDEVIYLNETRVHLQMKLNIMKERGPSITVIGAISEERGLIASLIISKNNN